MSGKGSLMSGNDKNPQPYPSGYIEYSFKMYVSHDKSLPFKMACPKVQEVTFKKKKVEDQFDPEWLMTIYFGPIYSMGQAEEIGNRVKDDIIDRLSLILKTKISEIRMIGVGLSARPGEGGIVQSVLPFSFEIDAHGRTGTGILSDCDIEKIRGGLLKFPRGKPRYLIRLFRYAINADDPVIQFLFLYLILYQIYEKQHEVDGTILRIAPNTPLSKKQANKSNRSSRKILTETVFTKLRNEIGHGREADLEITRREIINHLDDFRGIVHTALMSIFA